MFSGSIPNSLQVSISSEYVDSWKKLRNYNKLQKKSSRKFILRCYQQIMNPRIAFKLGVAVTQGGKCQEAKFYDVNSVNKRSCCRKSCKFASFSRKPAILMGEKRKPLWCYKTLIWKFYEILLFRCCKSCKMKLQLQNDLLPCNASHPKPVLNACFHGQYRSPCRLLTQGWALQKLTGNISGVSNWHQKTHLSNVHTEFIEVFFLSLCHRHRSLGTI